ncbi:MAG TPA: hypothetical protein VMA97_13495 [Streptosporangiaceae bacterium]|nr:hypothetical protein [Streptosporangiaceae bacterium]
MLRLEPPGVPAGYGPPAGHVAGVGGILIQAVSLLFLGYTMSASSIERQVRRTPLFRGDSMVMDILPEPGTAAAPDRSGSPVRQPGEQHQHGRDSPGPGHEFLE